MNSTSQDIERILMLRAQRYVERETAGVNQDHVKRSFIVASIGENYFGFPIEEIRGIVKIRTLAKLSGSAPGLIGLIHEQNQMICLFDTAHFIKSGTSEVGSLHYGLVIRSDNYHWALGCEQLHSIISLPEDAVHSNGSFEYQDRLALLLHTQEIINSFESLI